MSAAVLWRTCSLPLKNRPRNSCCLRGKYSCQFDPRECLKLALSCCWLRASQSNEDSLSWPVEDWHPRSRNGFNHPSSKGFKLYELYEFQPNPTQTCWNLKHTHYVDEQWSAILCETKKIPKQSNDPAVWLMLPFSYFASACKLAVWPPSGRCRTTNCSLDKRRHVWKAVWGSRFRQINQY